MQAAFAPAYTALIMKIHTALADGHKADGLLVFYEDARSRLDAELTACSPCNRTFEKLKELRQAEFACVYLTENDVMTKTKRLVAVINGYHPTQSRLSRAWSGTLLKSSVLALESIMAFGISGIPGLYVPNTRRIDETATPSSPGPFITDPFPSL